VVCHDKPSLLNSSLIVVEQEHNAEWVLIGSFFGLAGAPKPDQAPEELAMAKLKVNGKLVDIDVDGATPLLWVLREQLGLTGTKYSCGIGICGSCTVHINGAAVRSCITPVSALNTSQEITTIEGLSPDGNHPLQQAWEELDVPQCGYCQPGMIMSAAALLKDNPNPSDADIDANVTNICRCGTFNRIRRGIHLAANINKGG
jgi:isoquinoline 1-oxidoreductase alpha subunit